MKLAVFGVLLLAGMESYAQVEGLPEPGEPRVMKFAKPHERRLPNGLRVIVVDRPAQPLVTAAMVIRSGVEGDPAGLAGLTSLTAGLLSRGTTARSAVEFAREIEALGATFEAEASRDGTLATMTVLSSNAGQALALFAEAVCHPQFAPAEVERLLKERIDEVTIELEQPGQFARVAAARLILGTSPYSHAVKGTPKSLRRIRAEDVQRRHAAAFRPDLAALVMVGDLRVESAFAHAETEFGAWGAGMVPKAEPAPKTRLPKPQALLIDIPRAGQAAVYVGRAGLARRAESYFIGQLANGVLGGGYSARLNREIRIKRGLSYGCGSALHAWRQAGLLGAACQTRHESAAEVAKVILAEMRKLGAADVDAEELATRRQVLIGDFQRPLETNQGYTRRLADFLLHDLPPDSFDAVLAAFGRVSSEELRRFAASEFDSEGMSVVVVGKAKDCEKPLRELFPSLRVLPLPEVDLESETLD